MRLRGGGYLIVAMLWFLASQAWPASTPAYGPPATWIQILPELPARPAATNSESSRMVLLDRQVNLEDSRRYLRVVRDFFNPAGVQEGSRLEFTFDPGYEELTIHHVRILRGNEVLERLDPAKVRLIQPERSLGAHIYEGRLSAVILLEDVRVGDRLDYAFTLRGFNPVFAGRYAASFVPQWSVPVERIRFRLLAPADRPVRQRFHGNVPDPVIRVHPGFTEYAWDVVNSQPIQPEDSVPSWYNVYPWVQFSQYASWAEVAEWARPLYPDASLPPEMVEKTRAWLEASDRPEDRATLALQWVQDEIRYLGLEDGVNSHRPQEPRLVFERRYGDCKDKARLYCALLKEMGITAVPVLVNSAYLREVRRQLPSPEAFDHAVVRVRLPSGMFLADPTRSHQRGSLTRRYVPDYGYGLPVETGVTDLVQLPNGEGFPLLDTLETFRVRDRNGLVEFTVRTRAEGYEAEVLRAAIANAGLEELQRNYLNYYARWHPGISSRRDLQVNDSDADGSIEVREFYSITNFWKLEEGKTQYAATVYPGSFAGRLSTPNVKLRSMPLSVVYPRHERQRLEVQLPSDWAVDVESVTITSPALTFQGRTRYTNRVLSVEYELHTLTNCVTVADVPEHLARLDEIQEELGYTFYWPDEARAWSVGQVNWPVVLLAGIYTAGLGLGGWWWHRRSAIPLPAAGAAPPVIEPALASGPSGLGGWLILLGVGLFATAVRSGVEIVKNYPAYAVGTWHTLTTPGSSAYHPMWAPVLIYELLMNCTIGAAAAILLFFFFGRRRQFPRWCMVLYVGGVIVVAIDVALAHAIPAARDPANLVQLPLMAVRAVIWVAYLRVSKRVKATFTR